MREALSTESAPSTHPSRSARPWLVVLGVVLLGILVQQVGGPELLHHLGALGWRAPLILLPFALISWVDGWGWSYTLPHSEGRRAPSQFRIQMVRLAGEAVNNLTPTASIGGEAVKAVMLRRDGIDLAAGTVSVVVAKTALTIGQVVFILIGILLTLERFDIVSHGDVLFAGSCLAAAGFVWLMIRLQRVGLVTRVSRLAARVPYVGPRVERLHRAAPRIDADLAFFYATRGRDFAASSALHFLGWLLEVLEAWFLARLISFDLGWRDAFIVVSLAQPLTLATALIPGAIGVREAGGVAIFRLLGLDESAGLALWLLVRLRETAYSGIGLAYLLWSDRRAGSPTPSTEAK